MCYLSLQRHAKLAKTSKRASEPESNLLSQEIKTDPMGGREEGRRAVVLRSVLGGRGMRQSLQSVLHQDRGERGRQVHSREKTQITKGQKSGVEHVSTAEGPAQPGTNGGGG